MSYNFLPQGAANVGGNSACGVRACGHGGLSRERHTRADSGGGDGGGNIGQPRTADAGDVGVRNQLLAQQRLVDVPQSGALP